MAAFFAGRHGRVWKTTAKRAEKEGAKHLPRKYLLEILRGLGKGTAKWKDAFQVAQAARYVEEWSEHLLDWSAAAPSTIQAAERRAFGRGPE